MVSTKIANTVQQDNAFIHEMEVTGLSNLSKLVMVTHNKNPEQLNKSSFFTCDDGFDPGYMDGSSYQDVRHTFGKTEQVEIAMRELIDLITSADLDTEDNAEVFLFLFDAGNGNSLLVSNFQEVYYYEDTIFDESCTADVLHILAGGTMDDLDVDCIVSHFLVAHPLTKGFKMVGEDFEHFYDEPQNWDDFMDYCGSAFSGYKKMKSDEFFEMIKACTRLVIWNAEIFEYRKTEVVQMNSAILEKYEYCKNIPNAVRLEFTHGNSNKFYHVEINHFAVLIEYGAIGGKSTNSETDFQSYEEAKEFMDKKVISKIKSGYEVIV